MAAGGVWKQSSHADFGSQKQQEYLFPPEINVIKRIPTLSCVVSCLSATLFRRGKTRP